MPLVPCKKKRGRYDHKLHYKHMSYYTSDNYLGAWWNVRMDIGLAKLEAETTYIEIYEDNGYFDYFSICSHNTSQN